MARQGRPRIHLHFAEGLLSRYAAGDIDHHEVGRLCGVSPRVALRELRDAGMDTSRSTRKRLRRARAWGLADPYKAIRRLYNLGLSLREVARQFGMTQEGVRQALLRDDVRLRPPGAAAPWQRPDRDSDGRRFACCLRSARAAAGLSQVELAARSGLTRQTVSALERGARQPTRETLARLREVLGDMGLEPWTQPLPEAEAS
jgi:transcriptional regulator with XRE-family HTH domain